MKQLDKTINYRANDINPTNKVFDVTAEEEVEFGLLTKRQAQQQVNSARIDEINKMVKVAGRCHTTSLSGICSELYDAGYRFKDKSWPE